MGEEQVEGQPQRTLRRVDPLAILVREDPTLRVVEDEDTGGFLLAGMGELHLEIAVHRLEREFKLGVRAGVPRVSFRESIKQDVRATAELVIPGEEGSQVEVTLGVVLAEKEAPILRIPPQCPTLPEDLLHTLQNPNMYKCRKPDGNIFSFEFVHQRICDLSVLIGQDM